MGKYWVIADTHFGHEEIITEFGFRPRGYEEKIIKACREAIKQEDILIHLGDICFGNDARWSQELLAVCQNLWFVRGNHDGKSDTWYLSQGWKCACESLLIDRYGKKILFSHIPVKDCGQYDINIHGHFHNTDHRRHEPHLWKIRSKKQYLIALENTGYRPLNLQWVVEDFDKRDKKRAKKTFRLWPFTR